MNTESVKINGQNSNSSHETMEDSFLPEPDPDNITVLTHKLPNTPILPWNRYDSPWDESEVSQETETDKTEEE